MALEFHTMDGAMMDPEMVLLESGPTEFWNSVLKGWSLDSILGIGLVPKLVLTVVV